MTFRNRIWVFILIADFQFVFGSVNAQSPLIPSGLVGVDQGLSQNTVNQIFQDSDGFIWLATGDGLNRYDGKEVVQFYIPQQNAGNFVSKVIRGSITEDSKKCIWFGTETGFFYVDKTRDTVIQAENMKGNKWFLSAYHFRFCHRDSIWFSHPQKGFGYYAIATRKFGFLPFPEEPGGEIPLNFKISASFPYMWYCSPSRNRVYELDCRKKKYQMVYHSEKPIQYFSGDGKQGYLVISENRLLELRRGEKDAKIISDFDRKLHSRFIHQLIRDPFGRIWMASAEQGLFMLDAGNGKTWNSMESESGIPSGIITALFTDCWNMLWVGTDGGGAVNIDLNPPLFRRYPEKKEAEASGLRYFSKCLMEDRDGNIWVGTHQDGIYVLSPEGGLLRNIRHTDGNPLLCVSDLFLDSLNRVWIGYGNGVAILYPSSGQIQHIQFDMPEKPLGNTTFVNRFLYAGQGKILCATSYGLFLIRQDRTGLWKAAELKPVGANLPERLTEIVAVGKDRYLISAPPFGIFEADLIGDEILIHRIFLKGIDTRSLLIADGRCRIATTTGLADLDIRTGKFRILDRKNGLLNESIYGMVPDSRGNLWISSNQGLFLFDVSKENFRHFTAVSGLQSNEFNSGAFYKGNSGKIYFGGIHGINWFDPEHFYKKIKAPMVVLSGFFVNGSRKVQMKSITELQYDQNDIRFTFSAIDFSTPQGNKIRYCLRGWDENPILTEGREAIYNNLQPGSYRLEYQSCNARGEWSTLKRVDFYIRPPFWKTIWFYLLSGGSGIAFLIFIIQFNEKRKLAERLREAEQQRVLSEERIRISSEMHDDIGAGLTRISLMTQAARKQSGSSEDLIEGIGETSRQLVESMGEIIWSMSDESRSPAQIMAYIREMVNRQLEYSTMKPEFQFSLESPDIKLSNHLKRSLILMAKELVNNAIKYSGATCIRIGIVLEKSSLSLEVRDNGCGFSGETEGYGNGLKILKTRVEKSQGSFNAGNEQGAFVRIRIALK